MAETDIKGILAQLRAYRVETLQQAEEAKKKARQYDMLHDLTPQQEDEADALYNRQDALENQLDAIDTAIEAISCI